MAINTTYYGNVAEADSYFAGRLHAAVWMNTLATDKPKALLAATRIIDALSFKGWKATVFAVREVTTNPTADELVAAEIAQPLEFPRGIDTEVPEAVRIACYEIAYSLLDGKDPELELEALGVSSNTYGNVKTAYDRSQSPVLHLINGIPSAQAWRLLQPFLRDENTLGLSRVS